MNNESLKRIFRLMRDDGFSDEECHAVIVAMHIGAECSGNEKFIKMYGTIACDILRALHKELEGT